MPSIDLKVDASQLKRLESFCLAVSDKLNRTTAVAMTRAAKATQAELKQRTSAFLDRPTPWTQNSTFVKPATEARLTVTLGFKDYSSSGVPAAKYLQAQAVGGPRDAKGFEQRLRGRGLLGSSQFAVPTGHAPLKLNAYGNVPAGRYTQVLSRLSAMREAGYQGNRTDSARSKGKRRETDYFVATINGQKAVWARKGRRGIVPVFVFVNQPRYRPRFPVQQIIAEGFQRSFGKEFERAVQEQLAYMAKRQK